MMGTVTAPCHGCNGVVLPSDGFVRVNYPVKEKLRSSLICWECWDKILSVYADTLVYELTSEPT